MSRRSMVGTSLVVGLLVLGGPAWASELGEYLDSASAAEFSGTQVVSCDTPDGVREAVIEITQSFGAVSAVSAGRSGTRVAVAAGTLDVVRPDGTSERTTVSGEPAELETGYTVSVPRVARVLDRAAIELTVADGEGVERARLVFDGVTGALIESDVLNADGSVYCQTRMLDFSPVESGAVAGEDDDATTLEPVDADGTDLPADVAGFTRLDAYEWDAGGVIGYYTDGLFSFSLLATNRPVEMDAPGTVEVASSDASYQRWFGPGQVVMVWDTDAGGLALTGDLPVDLVEAVTAELPAPRRPGLLSRVWQRLFG